eukprot:14742629-Alexandrium_andersonii.AAC.1
MSGCNDGPFAPPRAVCATALAPHRKVPNAKANIRVRAAGTGRSTSSATPEPGGNQLQLDLLQTQGAAFPDQRY